MLRGFCVRLPLRELSRRSKGWKGGGLREKEGREVECTWRKGSLAASFFGFAGGMTCHVTRAWGHSARVRACACASPGESGFVSSTPPVENGGCLRVHNGGAVCACTTVRINFASQQYLLRAFIWMFSSPQLAYACPHPILSPFLHIRAHASNLRILQNTGHDYTHHDCSSACISAYTFVPSLPPCPARVMCVNIHTSLSMHKLHVGMHVHVNVHVCTHGPISNFLLTHRNT